MAISDEGSKRPRPRAVTAARLIDEHAALRRVATLVARGVPASELFAVVTAEVGLLLRADLAGMIRFEPADRVTAVATWAPGGEHPDVSGTWPLEGDRIATLIADTGRPGREDDWWTAAGPIAAAVRERLGVRSSVGSPIVVEGRVWGALFVHSTDEEPLPPDIEARLGGFTELIATAIANAQARTELHALLDEQAALRRVAELVARGSGPAEVFDAVAEELGKLTRVQGAKMLRYEPDETATFVASWGPLEAGIPTGTRLTVKGTSVTNLISSTGRPPVSRTTRARTGPSPRSSSPRACSPRSARRSPSTAASGAR